MDLHFLVFTKYCLGQFKNCKGLYIKDTRYNTTCIMSELIFMSKQLAAESLFLPRRFSLDLC